MRAALEQAGLPQDCIQLVADTSRDSANELMRLNAYVDVIDPQGRWRLIRAVVEHATVPVIETGVGNCHVYVDQAADLEMAAEIVFNAKTSRPSVCNACESLLVHRGIAEQALPLIKRRLDEKQVVLRGDESGCANPAWHRSRTGGGLEHGIPRLYTIGEGCRQHRRSDCTHRPLWDRAQ